MEFSFFRIMLFLHVLGAVALGFYLFFPFLARRLGKLQANQQEALLPVLLTLNRFGQYLLVVQLITGGYLIGKGDFSVGWIIIVAVLFLAMIGLAGMTSGPVRRVLKGLHEKAAVDRDMGKINTFSMLLSVLLLLLVVSMSFPQY